MSDKQKSKYIILTPSIPRTSQDNDTKSGSDGDGAGDGRRSVKLDQVPDPRVTLFRRDQVEIGYRGPTGPGSGMFNMGNTCYLNSTLQVSVEISSSKSENSPMINFRLCSTLLRSLII